MRTLAPRKSGYSSYQIVQDVQFDFQIGDAIEFAVAGTDRTECRVVRAFSHGQGMPMVEFEGATHYVRRSDIVGIHRKLHLLHRSSRLYA